MATFYMMIGLPGSGKSTKAEQIKKQEEQENKCVIVSSDEYRKMLFSDVNDQTHNDKLFKRMQDDTLTFLDGGISVIYDATNTTLKNRSKILKELKGRFLIRKVAVVVAPPLETCIKQDKERDRIVGEEVIRKFLYSFQFPQKFEGFDEIWLNDYEEDFSEHPEYNEGELSTLIDKMSHFDQRNPHHKYSLWEHCFALESQYVKLQKEHEYLYAYYNSRIIAGFLHDVGKLFTQRIDENGVAHYYNHDSVGAYYLASHPEIVATCPNWDSFFETLFYVNYHMRAHRDFKSPKAERKYRNLFGDDLYEKLMEFGEFDRIASGTYDKYKE